MVWIIVVAGVVVGLVGLVRYLAESVGPGARSKPGTLAWEAELTKGPLMTKIHILVMEKKQTTDPAKLAALEAEIDFLAKQVDELYRIEAQAAAIPGRGYVGFDVYGSKESSWAKAMGEGGAVVMDPNALRR